MFACRLFAEALVATMVVVVMPKLRLATRITVAAPTARPFGRLWRILRVNVFIAGHRDLLIGDVSPEPSLQLPYTFPQW